jgi:tetratricopeptide (TPR) repeat protein
MISMSRKNRKKRQQNVPQSERARRQLEKGYAKAALKEAKVCFRADPSDDNRLLLEEAFVGRVEQLHRLKQISDAKVVLAELLKLKPITPQVIQKIPRLRVILGDSTADAKSLLDSDPSLLIEMVDQAVLDPRAVAPDHGDIKAQVIAVREALAAVERGEDEEAAEQLTIISRNSPLSDWRLLVRGLSAFYEQDEERTKKNWGRLDATRPANRIAQTLLTTAGIAEPSPAVDLSNGLRKLERHATSDPAIEVLKKLAAAWRKRDWRPFFQCYRQMNQRFAKSHETLVRHIVDLVWKRAVRECDYDLLDEMSKIGPPPIIDPRWNRAEALLSEHPDADDSADEVESAWIAYAKDVSQLQCLREEERPIAEGLVYQRLAREFVRYADRMDTPSPIGFYDQEEQEELRKDAAKHFRRSIEACPGLQASYLELAELHEELDEADKAARVMEKLVRQDPDCFEAVIWLAFYYLGQDEPGKSERHVETAKRLRPRDPRCITLAWNQKVTMVRCLAIKRQFEAARQEIKEAAEVAPPELEPYSLDLQRAGIEFKAKNLDAANGHVDAALAKVEEPTPVWMYMSSVAARMRVAREFKKTFDDRFKADIKKRPTSSSAGRMARFLFSMKVSKANYTGRATQEKLLIEYLRRAIEIEWDESDLRHVCRFLAQLPRQRELQSDFVDVGLQRFPHVPHFQYWAGVEQMESGPFFCDASEAMELFQEAVNLHNKGDVKLSETELEHAMSSLSIVKDYHEQAQAFAGASSGYLDDEEEYDLDDYEENDDDDDFGFGMPIGGFDLPDGLEEGLEEGLASAGIDDAKLAMLERTMPPDIRVQVEQIAVVTGVDSRQALRMMIGAMALGNLDDNANTSEKQNTKMTRARKRKASRR